MMQCIVLWHVVRVVFLPDVPRAAQAAVAECVQILMIPTADFIGQTATSGSASLLVPHDLNLYSQCIGWQFTAHRHGKPQSFETSLTFSVVHTPSRILHSRSSSPEHWNFLPNSTIAVMDRVVLSALRKYLYSECEFLPKILYISALLKAPYLRK